MIYLRARFYNPADGRFQSRDTWDGDEKAPMSYNAWLYVYANPVNHTDPSGHDAGCSGRDCSEPHYSYQRFDKTLDYMYNEMIVNSQGDQANILRTMLNENCAATYLSPPFGSPSAATAGGIWGAYLIFFNLTRTNGKWDHKWQLRPLLHIKAGNWADEYFPIREDMEYEYFYDIWSNIHFGYVGASIGFPRQDLENIPDLYSRVPSFLKPAIKPVLGSNGPGDLISVKIGLDLWSTYGNGLTKQQLHAAILSETQSYLDAQDTNGNGLLDKSEVDPNTGPLLPKGLTAKGELIGDWK